MDAASLLPSHMQPAIQQALERGCTILTANQRAARTLRYTFDQQQHELGRAAWQPPAIFAWDTWTASLWRRLLLDGRASALLLNRSQEHALWTEIIASERATTSVASLRPIAALADAAAQAWLLLHAYRGRSRLNASAESLDTRTFARWAAEFERRCIRAHYLSAAQLAEVLRAAVASGTLAPAPNGIFLLGFDSQTPAQSALLDAIRLTRTRIDEPPLSGPSVTPASLVAADDPSAELTAAARWLRAELTAHPSAQLAVIVPALADERAEIDRVFRHLLAPELEAIAAPTGTGPYEFSLGIPLAQTPLIATALDLLRWVTGPLPLDRVTALLLSPHFAAGTSDVERLARAELDAFVLRRRQALQPELSLERLFHFASHPNSSPGLPILLRHLHALRALLQKRDLTSGERSHADWAATISNILEAAGWSTAARDTSIEFQTRRKWESALDELATLDFDSRGISFSGTLAALDRIAANTLFAPESRHAPIQIMGPLEAAGSTFDAIWFLRAGDLTWPANPSPNPLLPWRLQRELRVPGADHAEDAALARNMTERITASAPAVIFSYAGQSSTGERQRPSAALGGLSLAPCTIADIAPSPPVPEPIPLELIDDVAPIPAPPERILHGGAAILQAQAECGFRAFAEKRLFSAAPDVAELGLNPRDRGNLVHTALERLWSEVQTQAVLHELSAAQRDQILTTAVDHAIAQKTESSEAAWPTAYIASERRRLLKLLDAWLDYELTRPAFTVKSQELTLEDVTIGPLRLSVRVDRIDLTTDGGEIILDYKTGTAKPAMWLRERPEEPQLPLYAVLCAASNLVAIAFASVRPGKDMSIEGFEASPRMIPKSSRLRTATLSAQVDQWRGVLTNLATAFHAGDASVLPRQYPETCKHCKQRLLCRLNPASLSPDLLDEYEADFMPNRDSDFG